MADRDGPRTGGRLLGEIACATAGMLGLIVLSNPSGTAFALHLPAFPWGNRLFDMALVIVLVALGWLSISLLTRLVRQSRQLVSVADALRRGERGTIILEFVLVFPIFLLVMGMVIQIALLANASLVVRYAAFSAARAGIVGYERGQVFSIDEELSTDARNRIRDAAHLVVGAMSPATVGQHNSGREIAGILNRQNGVWGSRSYERRMRYAVAATTVTTNDSFAEVLGISNIFGPRALSVTVQYKFLITIPGISILPGITENAPAGVAGRVFTIEQTVTLQSTGARAGSPAILGAGSPMP